MTRAPCCSGRLPRTFSEYVRANAYMSAGGIYSQRYMRWATELVGVDPIVFATDDLDTRGPEGGAAHFPTESPRDLAGQERFASGNGGALVSEIRR
jgi:hypothetical protein